MLEKLFEMFDRACERRRELVTPSPEDMQRYARAVQAAEWRRLEEPTYKRLGRARPRLKVVK